MTEPTVVLTMPLRLDRSGAGVLKSTQLEKTDVARIDFSRTRRIDSAALESLLTFCRHANEQGVEVTLAELAKGPFALVSLCGFSTICAEVTKQSGKD